MEKPEDIIKIKNEFIQFARSLCPCFIIDDNNRSVVADLFNYFTNRPGHLNNKKGIWLEGNLGTGKSTLLRIFSKYLIRERKGFLLHSCTHICTSFSEGASLDSYTYGKNNYPNGAINMGFDELGREPVPVYRYKTQINVMQHILHVRYSLWQEFGIKTFITTNLDANGVENLYGDFIRDRRQEMFNIIPLIGISRRIQT
ncbi:P-loop NTPase family protein [Odoribacter laneus]|uniref:ATPase n=1 Tax=Odoribacter laneus YIT 12061 TaxID=742817 RepID=H1DHR6_9BACT|nr:hypothetical protein [Odoribacter laneus]EHP47195.1 hypothetical protein HMPREF9449_01802 [Odoribacter laneus YIT 12061]